MDAKEPAAQTGQTEDPGHDAEPGAHGRHVAMLEAFTVGEYDPPGQEPQSAGEFARGMKNWPAGQDIAMHLPLVAPIRKEGLYVPSGHCWPELSEVAPVALLQ